jgi:hypothetical protein
VDVTYKFMRRARETMIHNRRHRPLACNALFGPRQRRRLVFGPIHDTHVVDGSSFDSESILVERPGVTGWVRSWLRNAELPTNAACSVFVNLAMPWYGGLLLVDRIHPHRVTAPFPQQFTALLAQMLHEILSLHEATSPAGICTTSLLALKWR